MKRVAIGQLSVIAPRGRTNCNRIFSPQCISVRSLWHTKSQFFFFFFFFFFLIEFSFPWFWGFEMQIFKKKKGTVSVAVYGYRTHRFRRRIRLYNQNEAYNSVAVYGYGTNSPWNGSVAVQNCPLSMYESSQSFFCEGKLRIDCFPDLCKLVVHYLGLHI